MITPIDLAGMLERDHLAVDRLKDSESIPCEILPPLTPEQADLLTHPRIPPTAHARDHAWSYNAEQVALVRGVLDHYRGVIDTDLETSIGHPIVKSTMVSYGDVEIRQMMIRLRTPVVCRRVWLPPDMNDRVSLVRRHTSTGSTVDFAVDLDDTTRPFVTTTDTLILTIRHLRDGSYSLGTCFAGDKLPGGSDDGEGILYKHYKEDEARVKDSIRFIDMIATRIPALLRPDLVA